MVLRYQVCAVAAFVTATLTTPATAETITFDTIQTASLADVPNGYEGFNWNYILVENASNLAKQGVTGYSNGLESLPNVAFTDCCNTASFSRPSSFTLDSGYFSAAWLNDLDISVTGYSGTDLLYSTTFTVNATGPILETFNWSGITSVVFSASGGTPAGFPITHIDGRQIVMDNLIVSGVSPVPLPNSLTAFASALIGLAGLGAHQSRRRGIA